MNFIEDLGRYITLTKQVFSKPEKYNMYWKEIMRQMIDIGIGSLPIVFLISIFLGAVSAVQFSYQLGGNLIPMWYIGYIVRDMEIIELAPTITCLVLAGKVGSNMAAELAGMRQKEHIDAMEIMGVNTAAYLILPKIIAAVLTIPLLVSMAAFVAIGGAYVASVPFDILTHADFLKGLRNWFNPYNVFLMYVKAVTFSYILTTVSCYQGYYVKGGSIELGKASTRAVVYSDVLILVSDYIIAVLLTSGL